ncbi:hypothetical protein DPMN_009749 [Dreissena polymorpha]|uniref:Uncharacterized protein n=1 Tax=Dreissena polymorpha TaxID=45954 RepID=A0A9D4S0V7_DREPO|nr:hypothetical protein DPMN_009749 [Dreissena polymorpha]
MGYSVCDQFEKENIVCPSVLRKHIFTTGAVDNIDHNPSFTTAQGSFHGTGISIFQHPTKGYPGEARSVNVISIDNQQTRLGQLPDSYASIPPVAFHRKTGIPEMSKPFASDCQQMPQAIQTENRYMM